MGNIYFWQALATIAFCCSLRRLAAKFPAAPMIAIDNPVDVGPSVQQLLEEKNSAINDAASKIDNLDRENAGLRAKVGWLQSEIDFLANDRYTLIREKWILENKLGDFNSWPEFRIEYDQLTTEFVAMKRQRAREHILQEQTLQMAREAKAELAATKMAEARRKLAHSKELEQVQQELEQVQQERDNAKEKYENLLATTTAGTTTPAVAATTATTAATATTVIKGNSPGDIALQEENAQLTLTLRSQSSLLSKKSSDLDRMQSLLRTRSNHSALQHKMAALTITSLEESKAKAGARIAELERDLQEANSKAEEMEEMYMAVAVMSEGEGEGGKKEEGKKENEEEGSGGEKEETSWLLKQIVKMSKKGRKKPGSTAGGSEGDGSGSEDEEDEEEDDDDDDDGDNGDDGNDEEDGGNEGEHGQEGEEKSIYDENEELLKEMMGRP